MEKEKYGVHRSHCCVIHGCKYGDRDCPVVSGEIAQEGPCDVCQVGDDTTSMEDNLIKALKGLLKSFIDGTHYETINPYFRPEVVYGLEVLAEIQGVDDYKKVSLEEDKPQPPKWRDVLDCKAFHGSVDKIKEIAKVTGYRYLLWNGYVYQFRGGEWACTKFTEGDIK